MNVKRRMIELLSKLGVTVTSTRNFERLRNDSVNLESLSTWIANEENLDLIKFLTRNLAKTKAQHLQDLVLLFHAETNSPESERFFVEFGAADGIIGSNSLLLEKEYGWRGILAEPARIFHSKLHKERNCVIDLRCVSKLSGQMVNFVENIEPCLSSVEDVGLERAKLFRSETYAVETISLFDLLRTHDAPQKISFVSLDTEGSELSILEAFPFDEYKIDMILVEHNYRVDRQEIFKLLTRNGFKRIYEFSGLQDDYYQNTKLEVNWLNQR